MLDEWSRGELVKNVKKELVEKADPFMPEISYAYVYPEGIPVLDWRGP